MASRRKRGPVAFRPRLLTGLALSLMYTKRSTKGQYVQLVHLDNHLLAGQQWPLRVSSGRPSLF